MTDWKSGIDLNAPCWKGYAEFLESLPDDMFPDANALNLLLLAGTMSHNGQAIRFTPAGDLPGVDYERHIFETGLVSTRENSWHDLFNALVWCRMPRLKAAMNFLHFRNLDRDQGGGRGRLRDALTLLDESGVIVSGSNLEALNAIARKDWNPAFITHRQSWGTDLQVLVCGHAILEKFLDPYKAVTAHALLVHTPRQLTAEEIDRTLATLLIEKGWLTDPSGLSPLPLMGIPGWWTAGEQDDEFYADSRVFRTSLKQKQTAPVYFMEADLLEVVSGVPR